MDHNRRAFFSRGAGKAARAVSELATSKARANAAHWIRPPFAIEELDFLLACSRCGDCVDACPHNIIFPLSSKLGVKVYSTPAMDLNNKGCHLCEDWPCVQACKPKALLLPVTEKSRDAESESLKQGENDGLIEAKVDDDGFKETLSPKIATVFINKETCLPYNGPECGACRVCPVEGAMTWQMEKPDINQTLCTGCALCREACILESKAITVQSKYKPMT